MAVRRMLVKEMAYFHVWYELDGGVGHVVEDWGRWPRGEGFARGVVAGMVGGEEGAWRREGRWRGGRDGRVEAFGKGWERWDWTRVLRDGGD